MLEYQKRTDLAKIMESVPDGCVRRVKNAYDVRVACRDADGTRKPTPSGAWRNNAKVTWLIKRSMRDKKDMKAKGWQVKSPPSEGINQVICIWHWQGGRYLEQSRGREDGRSYGRQ